MRQIGSYILRSELGRGGMATVYLAEETLTRRLVALKLLHPELARSEDARRRFISEMQILTTIEHPNLLRCYHCDDIDGHLMMALEYVRGRTLRALLDEQGRLPVAEACRVAIGVLAALSVAHRHEPPIVHRDLKPENILLGDDGVIKVADFGIAKMLGTGVTTTTPHGTLQYMSPEQFEGLPTTASTDLYSLGIVLYEMLTGQRPFMARALMEIIQAHYSQPPPPFPEAIAREVPPRLTQLVFELLRKSPAQRPPSAQVVHAQIIRILQPAPVDQPRAPHHASAVPPMMAAAPAAAAAPPSPPLDTVGLIEQFSQPPPRDRSKNHGALWAVMVVLLLVLVGGALAFMAQPSTEETPTELEAHAPPAEPPPVATQSQTEASAIPGPPPFRSPRPLVDDFLAQRDPGGPVPEHPELQVTDYSVRVMVRKDLAQAQRGARIVASTPVDGVRPRVQIIRRPRGGRYEHWVLVGRYPTRSAAIAAKASLRPILNQGAMHIDLSSRCTTLGPSIDGVRECVPP